MLALKPHNDIVLARNITQLCYARAQTVQPCNRVVLMLDIAQLCCARPETVQRRCTDTKCRTTMWLVIALKPYNHVVLALKPCNDVVRALNITQVVLALKPFNHVVPEPNITQLYCDRAETVQPCVLFLRSLNIARTCCTRAGYRPHSDVALTPNLYNHVVVAPITVQSRCTHSEYRTTTYICSGRADHHTTMSWLL